MRALVRENERLRHDLVHDPLTGLLNRRGLADALTERDRGEWIVLVIDLDGFKAVNDTHGHAAGDALLRRVGLALRARAAESAAIAARVGGDEFVLALAGTAREATALAEDLRLPHRASVGWATLGQREPFWAALEAADGRMYAAKRSFRRLERSRHLIS